MVHGTAQSWVKSIKINKICDIVSWTFGSEQSLNMPCHEKYLFKSFETLQTEIARYYVKTLVAIVILSVPDPF